MKKSIKLLFVLFNICYFLFDYVIVTMIPNPILFGWLPLQLCVLFFLPVPASVVWGLYFNAFFKTQKHVDYSKK